MSKKLSEITSENVGGEDNLKFLKKIFSYNSEDYEESHLPGKPKKGIPDKLVMIRLNKNYYFCQIRIDVHGNFHCISYIDNDDGTISLGTFTMIYFPISNQTTLEELVNKYNFS